jgi:hypothetical protein
VICASHTTIRSAAAGRFWHRVELADDQGAPANGLDDLDLDAVTGTDLVGGAERHDLSVRPGHRARKSVTAGYQAARLR